MTSKVNLSLILLICLFSFISAVPPAFATSEPQIHGEAGFVLDVQSGQALYSKNSDEILAPASTTKIMTALLAIEKGNLNDSVVATTTLLNSKLVYGTQIYLEPGETMSLDNLLYALLLNSANDAAVTIAEYIGGNVDLFVKLMNQRAKEIGANHTTFKNPSGLSEEGHVTTARDLALIARTALQNPDFAKFVKTKSKVILRSAVDVPVEMINENKLLWRDPSVDGVKTGYTSQAENCLVASATRDGRQLIGVILKSPGREIYDDMQNLLDYGFSNYTNTVYKPAGTVVSSLLIGKETVDLVLGAPIIVSVKKGEQTPPLRLNVIPLSLQLQETEKGQVMANLELWQGQQFLGKVPLLASRAVSAVSSPTISTLKLFAMLILALVLVLWGIIRPFIAKRKMY